MSQSEIFGPGTCVYGFETLDGAVEITNSLPSPSKPTIRYARRLAEHEPPTNVETVNRRRQFVAQSRRQVVSR